MNAAGDDERRVRRSYVGGPTREWSRHATELGRRAAHSQR
jgi:hypothetical protein